MALACGAECLVCVGCSRWIWKRCTYVGSYDSETWPAADPAEFEAIPRICRQILAVYEDDLTRPQFVPPGGYQIDPACVIKRVTYEETGGRSPPYLIYIDHEAGEVVLAVRGLNLARESDYAVLLDNSLGMQMFDGGFVHHGLLKSAIWLLKRESETLAEIWTRYGGKYKMIFAGHSLGSGVAALMSVIVANYGHWVGGIPRSKLRCFAIAPARQDDFLPRTATPLEDIFRSVLCLPCLLFWVCVRDTFLPEERKLRDPRRLYAPGRMFHIVERKLCRCGRFPPTVRTAIPVESRFEHIVLSCNATSDHALLWIEKESQKALDLMKEGIAKAPPPQQRMERKESLAEEHKAALVKAVSLKVPHAVSPLDGPGGADEEKAAPPSGKPNWDQLVEKLFDKSPSRGLVLKKGVLAAP